MSHASFSTAARNKGQIRTNMFEKAQAIDPKLPGPHRFLAAVAKAQHRWADCIAEARRALQLKLPGIVTDVAVELEPADPAPAPPAPAGKHGASPRRAAI